MVRTYVALDLEFTGLDPVRDEIIEVGAVAFQGFREVGRFQSLVRPTIALPLQTERLTGIRRVDLDSAPRFAELRERLVAFLAGNPIVGQSAPRDVEVLTKQGLQVANPVYDTFELASILLPDLPSYSLTSIAERLNVRVNGAHRALADALVTKDVFLGLLAKAERLDQRTISEIVQLTSPTTWPLKQFFFDIERDQSRNQPAASLAAVLASKGGLDLTNVDFLVRGPDRMPVLVPDVGAARPELASLTETLDPAGAAERSIPGYEYRPEQQEMLAAVGTALEKGQHLLVEAGTGTGKSIAYLLPAADMARRTGQRVVISTNTINLQEQIVSKDLPQVEAILNESDQMNGATDLDLRTAVVKGRTNYLCLRRWSEFRRGSIGLTLDEVKVLCRILVWLPETTTGDRSELNLSQGEQAVWSRVSAQADDCLVGSCSFQKRGTCFLYRARRAAEGAHIVVVNHALLLSDLAASSHILPEYRHLVIDEAHHLEDEATRQFGYSVGRREILRHLDSLAEQRGRDRWFGLLTEIPARLKSAQVSGQVLAGVSKFLAEINEGVEQSRSAVDTMFDQTAAFARLSDDGDSRKRLVSSVRASPGWLAVEEAWDRLHIRLLAVGDGLVRLQSLLTTLGGARVDEYENFMLELAAQIRRNEELRRQLHAIVAAPEANSVTWVDGSQTGQVMLCAAPLQVGEWLRNGLFDDKASVILTSATLAADDGFDYTRGRLGIERADELRVGSPFDYESHVAVLAPSNSDFPEPNRPGHDAAVADALIQVALASGGRMLALFTSNSALRRARQVMRPVLERKGIVVLGQNVDGPRGQLLTALRSNSRTVLLGTSSFWEGIDVVGDALSVVVITKLPFGVPSDPVFAARSETFDDAFNQFAVPQAILRFRQGFGRLIRSKTDRGVAVVLDTRIRTKGYGAAFRRAIPSQIRFVPASELPNQIKAFLEPVTAE